MVVAPAGLDSHRDEPLLPEDAAEELPESTAEAPEEAEADPPCGRRLALVGEDSLEAAGEVLLRVSFETSFDPKQYVCFGCFASIPKQRVSMFRLNLNKQKTHPNSLKESIFGYFQKNLGFFGLFRTLVCYETVLFVLVVSI